MRVRTFEYNDDTVLSVRGRTLEYRDNTVLGVRDRTLEYRNETGLGGSGRSSGDDYDGSGGALPYPLFLGARWARRQSHQPQSF